MRNLSPEEIERERELCRAAFVIQWWGTLEPKPLDEDEQREYNYALELFIEGWLASAAVDRSLSSLPLSEVEG